MAKRTLIPSVSSIDTLLSQSKRIRAKAWQLVSLDRFKEGYSYPSGGSRLQGQFDAARRSLATRELFEKLESLGLVRINIIPDAHCSMDDLKGDCYDVALNASTVPGGERTIKAQEKAFEAKVERDGVWGVVGEYRTSADEQWEQADSCFGFVGDDWKDSGTDTDIMYATLKALSDAWDDCCKHCGRPRKHKTVKDTGEDPERFDGMS